MQVCLLLENSDQRAEPVTESSLCSMALWGREALQQPEDQDSALWKCILIVGFFYFWKFSKSTFRIMKSELENKNL